MKAEAQAEYYRRRVLRGLRIYFANQRWPRLVMSGVLALAGGIGFLSAVLMLHAGIERMWLRYPLAVLVAWIAFLGLVRLWVVIEGRLFVPDEEMERLCREGDDPGEMPSHGETTGEFWARWFDILGNWGPPDTDADGCLVSIALWVGGGLLLIVVAGIFVVVAGAPMLIAEIFLDAILVAALYKRMAQLDRRWWLTGAMDRTWFPVLWTMITLGLAGFAIQQIAPEAKSIGGFVRHVTQD